MTDEKTEINLIDDLKEFDRGETVGVDQGGAAKAFGWIGIGKGTLERRAGNNTPESHKHPGTVLLRLRPSIRDCLSKRVSVSLQT